MDDNTLKILTLVVSTVSALGLAYVGYLTLQANLAAQAAQRAAKETAADAKQAAEKVQQTVEETNRTTREATEQVRTTLAVSQQENSAKLDTIHGLVNSRLSAALAKIDALEERLFETEGRPPTGEPEPPPETARPAQSVLPPPITEISTAAAARAAVDVHNAQREAREP